MVQNMDINTRDNTNNQLAMTAHLIQLKSLSFDKAFKKQQKEKEFGKKWKLKKNEKKYNCFMKLFDMFMEINDTLKKLYAWLLIF